MQTETLHDCQVTYHLVNGQTVTDLYHKDLPKEVWALLKSNFTDELLDYFEIETDKQFSSILLPKTSVLYITMKVSG